MSLSRRHLLRSALACGAVFGGVAPVLAQAGSLFPLRSDAGGQVYNYRLPAELGLEGLPGIVWHGAKAPELILAEFFDYNCPYCRAGAGNLDGLVGSMPDLALGLVNNPILGLGSVQAAKVQQAVLRAHGPGVAYAFHLRLLARKGQVDGPAALQVASDLGLDAKAMETAADLPQVGDVVKRQDHLADGLGFSATPSFMLGNIGILGYPGPKALAQALDAFRRCDKLACG